MKENLTGITADRYESNMRAWWWVWGFGDARKHWTTNSTFKLFSLTFSLSSVDIFLQQSSKHPRTSCLVYSKLVCSSWSRQNFNMSKRGLIKTFVFNNFFFDCTSSKSDIPFFHSLASMMSGLGDFKLSLWIKGEKQSINHRNKMFGKWYNVENYKLFLLRSGKQVHHFIYYRQY